MSKRLTLTDKEIKLITQALALARGNIGDSFVVQIGRLEIDRLIAKISQEAHHDPAN